MRYGNSFHRLFTFISNFWFMTSCDDRFAWLENRCDSTIDIRSPIAVAVNLYYYYYFLGQIKCLSLPLSLLLTHRIIFPRTFVEWILVWVVFYIFGWFGCFILSCLLWFTSSSPSYRFIFPFLGSAMCLGMKKQALCHLCKYQYERFWYFGLVKPRYH